LTNSLVIPENERPVLSDWTAAGRPELVAMERRYLVGIEETSSIQSFVTKEPIRTSMELVGPRLILENMGISKSRVNGPYRSNRVD
jgi:hypothetical protein